MSVRNKQNSSGNFLVRADRSPARPPDHPSVVITIPHSLNGRGVKMTEKEKFRYQKR